MSNKIFTTIDNNVNRINFLSTLVDKVIDRFAPKMTASAVTCSGLRNAYSCFNKDHWVDAPAMCGGQGAYVGRWGTVYYYNNGRKVVMGSWDTVCVYQLNASTCPSSTCS